MRTIISNIRETTSDFHPVVKYLVQGVTLIILAAAAALFIGVIIGGAPNW